MYGWLLTAIFSVILIRITMKWWYEKLNSNAGASLIKRRFVYNQNASLKVHIVNGTGYILKMFFNYVLYDVSSLEWFKKKAIEETRRELNGFELSDFGDEMEMNLFGRNYFNQAAFYRADPSISTANLGVRLVLFLEAMKERLRIVHQLKSHPEIRQINVGSPICIMGLLRTGTTLLFSLLALDPLACYTTFDLCMHPSLPWNSDSDEPDPRVKATEHLVSHFKGLMPNFDKAHYFDTQAPEECTITFSNMGLDYISVFGGKDLAVLKYILDNADFQQVYEYHRLLMQFLCYKKKGFTVNNNHCVFKCPFHLFHLSSFLKVYNTARVIIIHRDMTEVLPSSASLMEISSNSSYVDRFDIGRKALQVCGIFADVLVKETAMNNNNKNFIHLQYSDLRAPLPSKPDLRLGTLKLHEIFRICWGCSGEATIKFSALYHVI